MNTSAIGQQAPSPIPETLALEPEAPEVEETPVEIHRNRWGSVTETPPDATDEWHTPAEVIALVREVLGTIDVDPASSAQAQETVQATTYYTQEEDGLRHPWHGTVFLNPPFSSPRLPRYCGKLLEELDTGHTTAAIMLTNSVTDTGWFHRVAPRADAICFTKDRIPFIHATREGLRPCQGQMFCYFGPHTQRFREVFAAIGLLVQVVGTQAEDPQLSLAAAKAPAPDTPDCPPFDTTKFYLGKLCPAGHEWGSTGQTRLRIKGHYCPDCNSALKRQRYKAQQSAVETGA
jgi:ParB family chromosome partitioning protein